MSVGLLCQQMVYGAMAASGFGVLFNFGLSSLGRCAGSGAIAVGVRGLCMWLGLSLEGASFAAALTVSFILQLFQNSPQLSTDAFGVVGCLPLIPGSLAAKAIVGLFALTTGSGSAIHEAELLSNAVQNSLGVLFTIIAIGTGLAIPSLLGARRSMVIDGQIEVPSRKDAA
jgi:uncharacterized membrane protein YjjB (DUF3815 family)